MPEMLDPKYRILAGQIINTNGSRYVSVTDASFHGLSAQVSGAVNAQALNQALSLSSVVYITEPGTYEIASADLVGIRGISNRRIICAEGVTIKGAAGWRGYLVKCDNITNFHIEGGIWDGNGDNRTGTLGTYYSSDWVEFDIVFVGCTNVSVRNSRHINARRRCLWFTGVKGGNTCENVLVEHCSFDTKKVAVQVIGPVKNVRLLNLNIAGSEDDGIAVLGNDWDSVQPIAGGDALNGGDVEDVTIENVRFSIDSASNYPLNGIKLISGGDGTNPYTLKNVTVRNIKGKVQRFGVVTNPDNTDASTALHQHNNLLIEDVEVEITGGSTSYYPISILASDTLSTTILRDIRQRTATSGLIFLGGYGSGELGRTIIESAISCPSAGQALIRVGALTVNYLKVSNSVADLTTSSMIDVVGATVKRLHLAGCTMTSGNVAASMVAFRTTAGGCILQVDNCSAENVRNVFSYQGTAVCTHYLNLSNFVHETSVNISSPFTALINVSGSAVHTMTIKISNFTPIKGAAMNANSDPSLRNLVLSGGAHVVRLTGTSVLVDGAVLGGPVEGDIVNNSNAAFGGGVGTNLYTGAAWAKQ